MTLKGKSVKKLASLTTLGAGALAFAAKNADATIVYVPNPSGNTMVGFDNGFTGTAFNSGALAGGPHFTFSTSRPLIGGQHFRNTIKFLNGGGAVSFIAGIPGVHTLGVFASGKTFNTAVSGARAGEPGGRIAGRSTTCGVACSAPGISGNASFTNKYALFKFTSGANTDFGWVKLSLVNSNTTHTGPDLTIISFAYDNSGATIHAGDTGQAPTPEPGTLATTGLAALVLGAAGLRRWRAARKA